MYDRTVGNLDLTLVVSGKLWQRSLVMMDRETGSLWSHLPGKCMSGTLKGHQLKPLPGSLTDWASWKARHPETTVMILQRVSNRFTRDVYKDLTRYVAGMAAGGSAKAWSFQHLSDHPLLNDTFDNKPIVISFQSASATPVCYERKIDGQILTFVVRNGKTIDQESESEWDLSSGVARSGPMRGKQLQPTVIITSFAKAWKSFHPNSKYYQAERE